MFLFTAKEKKTTRGLVLVCLLNLLLVLSAVVPNVVLAENDAPGSITVDLRATGLEEEVFNQEGFIIPPGEVIIQDGLALDRQTAMGAPPENDWVKNGKTVLDALLKFQQADGSFWWMEDTAGAVEGSTAQSLVALVDLAYGASTKHKLGEEIQFDPQPQKLANAIEKTIQWYKANDPAPENWQGLPDLRNAGQNLNASPWKTTQDWRQVDPGFTADAAGNEHIQYIFRLLAVGLNPADIWGGRNLFSELAAQQRQNDGSFGSFGSFGDLGRHIWAIVALDAGEGTVGTGGALGGWKTAANRQSAVSHLLEQQNEDGSFGSFSQLDYTSWALVALSNYQGEQNADEAIAKAVTYLKSRQKDNGGFDPPTGPWGPEPENADSNAAVISGLVAAGEKLLVEDSYIEIEDINTPLDITLQEDSVSTALKISTVLENDRQTATLPSIEVKVATPTGEDHPVMVSIPQETVVRGPSSWDGTIKLPELKDPGSVKMTDGDVKTVIEVGFPAGRLDFDQPVRIVIPGQAGRQVGYTNSGAPVTNISQILSADSLSVASAELAAGDAGKIDLAGDLVIWTTHFTKFVVYTPTSGNGDPAGPSAITVSVQVVGKNAAYFSGNVNLPPDRANALEALRETGVSFSTRENDTYIYKIAGEEEDLTSTAGWKYKVNGMLPGGPAKYYSLSDGDQVMWFWAADTDATGPGAGRPPEPPVTTLTTGEIEELKEVIAQHEALLQGSGSSTPLMEALNRTTVFGSSSPLGKAEKEALEKQLNGNTVNMFQLVEPGKDILVSDRIGETLLHVYAGSLAETTEITLEEISATNLPALPAFTPLSPTYRLGPEGTKFSVPVVFAIRLAIPDELDPANLLMARFDAEEERWYALPTVVDVSSGYISALVDHFSIFTVLIQKETPGANNTTLFQDVTKESCPWAYEAISCLAERKIVQGVGNGKFEPSRNVTRAEFTVMLVKALGLSPSEKAEFPFTDVNEEAWHYEAINAALQAGIVMGITETAFQPNENITREQMAVMLSRVKLPVTAGDNNEILLSDMDAISPWASSAVKQVIANGLFKGFPDGSFKPQGSTTRAQTAVIIYQLLTE